MLTLGCNDSNFLPLYLHFPHNKWMEMRGNKRMRWNHFQRHYSYFPPISLIKCCALLMITNTRTGVCVHIEKTLRLTHSHTKRWTLMGNKQNTNNQAKITKYIHIWIYWRSVYVQRKRQKLGRKPSSTTHHARLLMVSLQVIRGWWSTDILAHGGCCW